MEWKKIKGYQGMYEISESGIIKSNYGNGRLLKLHKDTKGYLRTTLSLNGKSETAKVHRVVAIHFIPNPDNKPQVNHIDNDKTNNHVDNLEWVTNKENMAHANSNGYRDGIYCLGESHGLSKLNKSQVIEIRNKYKLGNYTQSELGNEYNVSGPTIGNVVNYKTWTHV